MTSVTFFPHGRTARGDFIIIFFFPCGHFQPFSMFGLAVSSV